MNSKSTTKSLVLFSNVFKMGKNVSHLYFSVIFAITALFSPIFLQAQQDKVTRVQQDVAAFVADYESDYDLKRLNLRPRDVGSIFETEHEFEDFFMLRSTDKVPNKIGQKKKLKLYVHAFSYENPYVLENALRFWFDNFVGGEQIRPGRKLRGYDNARPMYVVIRTNDVIIFDIDCLAYDEDVWKNLTKQIKTHFDPNKEATIIEIFCDGPLEWRQNPPDFRKR
ncbi:MAG: hypothetical protein LAT54_07135 [Cryomorphaceae bacterium]|nr:hypothetical protein [Cryomorphaceae bacterium]